MTTTLRHKRGDTLSLGLTWAEGGAAIDLSGYVIAAQLRDARDELVADLAITVADQTTQRGQFAILAPAEVTATWPPGRLDCDIQFTAPAGTVASTETFSIQIIRDVTR